MSYISDGNCHIDGFLKHAIFFSKYFSTKKVFTNSYPWLFPGGEGDIFDFKRGPIFDLPGPINSVKSWAKHLINYCNGRFVNDQLFTLYIHNVLQRHKNNSEGNYFFNDNKLLGKNPPSLEELKEQIRGGNFTFVSKLRHFSRSIHGSDGYWRNKTNELQS